MISQCAYFFNRKRCKKAALPLVRLMRLFMVKIYYPPEDELFCCFCLRSVRR